MEGYDYKDELARDDSFENAIVRSRYNGIMRLLDDALSADDYHEFIDNVSKTLSQLFDASLVTVYLLSSDKTEFIEQTNVGKLFPQDSVDYARVPREIGRMAIMMAGRQLIPMNFRRARFDNKFAVGAARHHDCAVSVPLFIDKEVFGFYSLVYDREISWTKRDIDYLHAVGHMLGIIFKRVYSKNTMAVQTSDLRECRMLSREIRKELEAILAQTKAEKPETIESFSEKSPISPGDAFRPSPREAQLMAYAAEGFTNKEIADALSISESAVKKMFVRLAKNSGLRNRAHMAAYAVRKGFSIHL